MKITVKLGGFIFTEKLNSKLLRSYIREIKKLSCKDYQLVIVAGGGETARKYIQASRELGASEAFCDNVGIQISRANALLLLSGIWDIAFRKIPQTLEEAITEVKPGHPVVIGGLQPGQSTNAVAALISELIDAETLVNLTDVPGVYTKDPKRFKDAKMLHVVTTEKLKEIISSKGFTAGQYELFDPVALRIIQRAKIHTIITSGLNPDNLTKAIQGEKIGTDISLIFITTLVD